jgi:hypothetical protein
MLAAAIFCIRSAGWTRFLAEPLAGLLTLLAVFRQRGWRECSSLGLLRLFGFPRSLAGTGWIGFDHEDMLAYAITSGAVARHCADADGPKPLRTGTLASPWGT